MNSFFKMYKKVLLILLSVAAVLIAGDYFPIRPNYSWVYDIITLEDSIPKDAGDLIYTLGKDTLINGVTHIPRIFTFREEGKNADTERIMIGYLIDGNPIMMVNDTTVDVFSGFPAYSQFYFQHSYTGQNPIVIDDITVIYRPYGEYRTPCGIFKNCIALSDTGLEIIFIFAPDVGVVGVQFDYSELILRRHGPGGANEVMSDNLTPTIIKEKNEEPILLRNGRIWIPSAYTHASKILVYTADGKLIAHGGKGKDQIDLSNTGSGMRMLLVKIILGDSMFTTRVSIVR